MPEQASYTPPNESYLSISSQQQDTGQQNQEAESDSKGRRTIPPKPCDYSAESDGLYLPKLDRSSKEWVKVRLTNFTAKIAEQAWLDDGQDVHREYEIEARLRKLTRRCRVPASQFGSMNWVPEMLGAEAVIMPGHGLKDHTRAAIQLLSGKVPEAIVFTHTGWRKIDGVWVYLHGAGGIGPDGEVKNVNVSLQDKLSRYKLPLPPSDLREATCASLSIADVAPHRITIPLIAAIYRAAMKAADCTVHFTGETGALKTALAALGQQHYGAEMDAQNLPGSWMSTANATEALAFYAKDALFVVDDFVPAGSRHDRSRKNADADRLIRAQGNGAGRDRMRSDGTIASAKKPRGLLLSTGEATPAGESLRGRMLVIDIEKGNESRKGDVDLAQLTRCQKDARDGRYAEAMAGFVQWLAARYSELQKNWQEQFESYRGEAATALEGVDFHGRLPEAIANLAMGWRYFLARSSTSNRPAEIPAFA